jgi:hypothetical protein
VSGCVSDSKFGCSCYIFPHTLPNKNDIWSNFRLYFAWDRSKKRTMNKIASI